jgi:uncharacterized membrane protein
MPVGTVVLIVAGVLIFFGFAQRVLDRMRLTDRQALLFIGLAVVGSFIDVTVWRGQPELTINLGGSLIPVILAVWLIATADTAMERWRAVFGAIAAGAALYGLEKILPREPQVLPVDPTYAFAVLAGLLAYILGRSRRGALAAAFLGVTIADLASWVELLVTRTPGRTWLGGAGIFDATVVAGLVAVLVAELVGETAELASGGPRVNRLRKLREGADPATVDLSERGSSKPGGMRHAKERREDDRPRGAAGEESSPERNASSLGPRPGRGADEDAARDPNPEARLRAARATRGGPGSGDLDRIELEETETLEAGRRSPTDDVRARRADSGGGEPR